MNEIQNEISLKDIVQKIKGFVTYLLKKWIWIGVAGIVGGVIGVIYAWSYEPKYTASLSFILSSGSDANSGLIGIANQFGLNFGTGSENTFSSDNIISLMTSRNIVRQALQRKIPEENETLLNVFCKDGQLNESWDKLDRTKGAYPFPSDSSKLTSVQDSLVRAVIDVIKEDYLDVSKPDDLQSIFVVSTVSEDELFSQYLTKSLVDVTANFYIDTKTKSAKDNLTMIQNEADSLRNLLSGTIASTAKVYDYTYNLNPALQSFRAPAQEGQMNMQVVAAAYGEVLKNLEVAKINLQQQTPLYQIIDEPHLPLIAEKPGKLFALIIGGFLGGFLMICFLLARKIFLGLWY
jgi:capsule polysaccharide export protein KpsE/RkpR